MMDTCGRSMRRFCPICCLPYGSTCCAPAVPPIESVWKGTSGSGTYRSPGKSPRSWRERFSPKWGSSPAAKTPCFAFRGRAVAALPSSTLRHYRQFCEREAMTPSESMITIITPSYNQAAYIEQTIQSVLRQDYARGEHIVMHGGSTDGTVDILNRYPHLIWRSEKDRGQADALNKGLALAKGDIIGWINSDDYYQEDIFSSVVEHFQTTGASWLVGRQADVFENGTLVVFRPPKY